MGIGPPQPGCGHRSPSAPIGQPTRRSPAHEGTSTWSSGQTSWGGPVRGHGDGHPVAGHAQVLKLDRLVDRRSGVA
jgi:hypothetical protein